MNSTSSLEFEANECVVDVVYKRMVETTNLYTQPERHAACAICQWFDRVYWVLSYGQVIAICGPCSRNLYELDDDGFKLIFEKAGVPCADHRR